METLIMAGQLILSLTILVGLHEMGHMLSAKYFGMRVEKFSIGFPPKLFKFTIGDTEYSFGLIPLGGFVKISGMVDESLDTKNLSSEPQPWEFRSKPAGQRLVVMLGGIIVNVITAVVIFIGLTYIIGDRFLPASEVKHGIVAHPLAQEMGLKTGDKIIAVNEKKLVKFDDIYSVESMLASNSYYSVERDSQLINVKIPTDLLQKLSSGGKGTRFIDPIYEFKVGQVMEGSPAKKAGIRAGDKIIEVDSTKITYFHQFQDLLKSKGGLTIPINVLRENDTLTFFPTISSEGKLGFVADILLKDSTEKYSLAQATVKGTSKAFMILVVQTKAFGKMFKGEINAKESLSGPIGIAKEFGSVWDWERFWGLTGLLSMVLAFMNLLPIPALDGGHVMFLLYEIISGKKPSEKFLENSQKVGMAILLSLMAFAFFNDISKLF